MPSPLPASRWDFDAAAYLLVRAGFGGSRKKFKRLSRWDRKSRVDSLINPPLENELPPARANPDDQDELRAQMQEAATPEAHRARCAGEHRHHQTRLKGTKTEPPLSKKPTGNSLSLVSRLISGGLPTRIYCVSQGGYDIHAGQMNTHTNDY